MGKRANIGDLPMAVGRWAVMRHSYQCKSVTSRVINGTRDEAVAAAQAMFARAMQEGGFVNPPRFYVVQLVSVVGMIDGKLRDGSE